MKTTVDSIAQLRVYVGKSDTMTCISMCPSVALNFNEHLLVVDMHILAIKCPDIVLGILWLQKLGSLAQNFSNMSMVFTSEERLYFEKRNQIRSWPIIYGPIQRSTWIQ